MSKTKTTYITPEEYEEEEFKHPSAYYIKDCLMNRLYFHTRDRSTAQSECNNEYGKGKYTVVAARLGKKPEKISAK